MENTNIDIKEIIAKNIIKYRKALGYTQAELAEMLNYSDKTLSKWERAESIPDVITLKQLADLFETTVDVLISDIDAPIPQEIKVKGDTRKAKLFGAFGILSIVIVLAVATLVFTFFTIAGIKLPLFHPWISFIYAIPIVSIIMLVFSCIWGNRIHQFFATSGLIWSLSLSTHLTLFRVLPYMFLLYIVAIPIQVLAIVFYFLIRKGKKV